MTRLILDTQLLLWSLYRPELVPPDIASSIRSIGNEVLFSAASIWEIAVKSALRRPDVSIQPDEVISDSVKTGFVELSVTAAAAARVPTLPLIHKDPFDRLLVAQAICEPARLLTADRILAGYSDLVRTFDPIR